MNPPAQPATGERPAYPIGSVDNALRLLLMFRERRTVRIAEASREMGVARSTAHRLMQMLQYHGFIEQDPESKAYVAGPALVEVGLSVVRDLDVRALARPYVKELVDELGETVHLVQRRGRDILFLDTVESPRLLRVGSRTGMTLPAHSTAGGKALLAPLSKDELRALYPEARLKALTERTTTSRRKLEEELERVRELGYATNFGEGEVDVGAVAVAVGGQAGDPVAAVSVSSPLARMTEDMVPQHAAALQEVSARMSAYLP
jgi:IclR family transcriptional regulator, acetate operon repressor